MFLDHQSRGPSNENVWPYAYNLAGHYLRYLALRVLKRVVEFAHVVQVHRSLQADRDAHATAGQEVVVARHADHFALIVPHRYGGEILVQEQLYNLCDWTIRMHRGDFTAHHFSDLHVGQTFLEDRPGLHDFPVLDGDQ